MPVELPEPWSDWRRRRPAGRVRHLDSAAAGRSSLDTIECTAAHLRAEAETGAYIAEAQAADAVETLRSDLGELLGMPSHTVAFVGSATAGLRALLASWPLPLDAGVAVAPGEWGPNLAAFAASGLRPVVLDTDTDGRIDLTALEHRLRRDPPSLIHITQVAAHSGVAQPATEIAAIGRRAGVPVWVDAAQALGHVDAATAPDAVYATARKWLCGPRGVAVLAIADRWWPKLRLPPHVLAAGDLPAIRAFEAADAHIAGRIGFAQAVREFRALGPGLVWQRLEQVGTAARAALPSAPGWELVDGGASAIVALRPTLGQDVLAVRARLLADHGILTTATAVVRAPLEMTGPTLRVSPHVDCTESDLQALLDALEAIRQT